MNKGRRKFNPPSGLTGSPLQQQTASSKPNRLSRSYRRTDQTQTAAKVESPKSQQSDFKTPTRIPRPRAGGGFSVESPHNSDSDFQQDIIWDATSPSPKGLGKRGKKQLVGVVDISEIVSRIAPKHGRPKAAEPTLQQWIGDSATIPCTPDVQVPKPKKKSPRLNGVDDLLKLAKQFDFNMFRQDEDEEDEHSLELPSEDVFGLENADPDAANGTDVKPDPHMDDDLDFLFDGPTQHVSGGLSQVSTQVKPSSSSSANTNTKGTLSNDAFEDDWDDDDLLNDSLVLEMTQNPQNFTALKHCSTQKPSSPVRVPVNGGVGLSQSAVRDKVRQSFKLESNPNFSVRRIQTDSWTNGSESKDAQQSRFSSSQGVSVEAGSQWNTVKSEPQKPPFHQRTSVKSNTTASAASNTSSSETAQSFSSRHEAPADLPDDDLLSIFSSDTVWDDPADDDLLCEVCEDLENQIQSTVSVSAKQTVGKPRAALQPANWNPPSCAGSSLAGGFVSNVAAGVRMSTATGSFRGSTCVQGSSRLQGNARKGQFTFKKPSSPVSTVTSKVVGKCSAAEIELKKQQAMERRRRRLQETQNLRAPT